MGKPSSSSRSADRIAVDVRESGDGHIAEVTVRDRESTKHQVRISRAERARYGGEDVADPVRRSFGRYRAQGPLPLLLARESSTSILREFDLSTIERYFPEYAREIVRS